MTLESVELLRKNSMLSYLNKTDLVKRWKSAQQLANKIEDWLFKKYGTLATEKEEKENKFLDKRQKMSLIWKKYGAILQSLMNQLISQVYRDMLGDDGCTFNVRFILIAIPMLFC
jgi:hypothetical protein